MYAGETNLNHTNALNLLNTVKRRLMMGIKAGMIITNDVKGNMIKDLNKGMGSINYNHLNLPAVVNVTGNKGGDTDTISYIYDALQKTVQGKVTQYAWNYVYAKENGVTSMEFFNTPEGYVEKAGSVYKYVYQHKSILHFVDV